MGDAMAEQAAKSEQSRRPGAWWPAWAMAMVAMSLVMASWVMGLPLLQR